MVMTLPILIARDKIDRLVVSYGVNLLKDEIIFFIAILDFSFFIKCLFKLLDAGIFNALFYGDKIEIGNKTY